MGDPWRCHTHHANPPLPRVPCRTIRVQTRSSRWQRREDVSNFLPPAIFLFALFYGQERRRRPYGDMVASCTNSPLPTSAVPKTRASHTHSTPHAPLLPARHSRLCACACHAPTTRHSPRHDPSFSSGCLSCKGVLLCPPLPGPAVQHSHPSRALRA